MTLFLLRAYGDFLIAVNVASRSTNRESIFLIASKHLEPLYEVIAPELPGAIQIRFVDFSLDKQLMRCFTNRFLLHPHTLTELYSLRRLIRKGFASGEMSGELYLEQQKRIFFPRFFCGMHFRPVVTRGKVYEAYARFFSVPMHQLETFGRGQKEIQNILIVPDSRQSIKVIRSEIIQQLQDHYARSAQLVTVAYFKQIPNGANGHVVVYENFHELIQLIKATDLLIGGDSLPVHLAQLLGIPHHILYPGTKSTDFFTPYALQHRTYHCFEDLRSGTNFLINGH